MSGEGSIFVRRRLDPDGKLYTRWVAQVSSGPRGARKLIRRVCRTRTDARRALDELKAGRPAPSTQTLGSYLRSWLDETAAPSVSANTLRGYEDVLMHLRPIADIPLVSLTAEDVEWCVNRMTSNRRGRPAVPAAPKTIRNAQIMLRAALGGALRRGHVARNVASEVPLRRVPRRQVDALTPEAAAAVLQAVKGDRYEAAFALALLGLRASEILGLAWSEVDLGEGKGESLPFPHSHEPTDDEVFRSRSTDHELTSTDHPQGVVRSRLSHPAVYIRYQLVGSGKAAARAQPKTRSSERTVFLPPSVAVLLAEHRTRQREERIAAGRPTTEGLVFLTPRGYAVNGPWLTRHLQAKLEAAGLPRLGLHLLRHAAASLMADAGVHPAIAQAVLGHASMTTTMGVYSHVTAEQQRAAVERVFRKVAGE